MLTQVTLRAMTIVNNVHDVLSIANTPMNQSVCSHVHLQILVIDHELYTGNKRIRRRARQDFQPPVPNWVNSSHSYILIGTCLQIKKIYDRVIKAAALCIFDTVNDCSPKVCLEKGKKHKNYLYTQSKQFLLFCLYLQTIVIKHISIHISLPKIVF